MNGSHRSVFLKISIALVFFYVIYQFVMFVYLVDQASEREMERALLALQRYSNIGHDLLMEVEVGETRNRLSGAVDDATIHFFSISRDGVDLVAKHRTGLDNPILYDEHPKEGYYEAEDYRYLVRFVGKYELIVGQMTFTNSEKLDYYWKQHRETIFKDIAFVVLAFIGIVFYSFRDLRQFVRSLRTRGLKHIDTAPARSFETSVIMRGFNAADQSIEDLSQKNTLLGRALLPALKTELLSGRTPPYDFTCTLVRTDINNFSHIYNNHDVGTLMKVIDRFFTEVTHIVSRYRGLIHEFVGDEVIFYFKDEDHENSVVIALSALRDINNAAARFNEETLKSYGYPFTVKSSLAHGRLRFGPLVNGYSLAGATLIETVRILTHVVEKSENVIYFEARHTEWIKSHCQFEKAVQAQLKGYRGESVLYRYLGHRDLADVLAALKEHEHEREHKHERESTASDLAFYLNDQDIVSILRYLQTHYEHLAEPVLLQVIRVLRGARVTQSDVSLRETLLSLIEDMANKASRADGLRDPASLSAVVMLMMNLVLREQYDSVTDARMARLLMPSHERLMANVLEVRIFFGSENDSKLVSDFLMHDNNRIAGNALIHEGVKGFTSKVMRRMRAMLKSQDPAQVASALYAIGELASHHKKNDAVYYNTQTEFQRIVGSLHLYITHVDAMVRRQALMAMKKAADKQVLMQVWDVVKKNGNGSLLDEALRILGPEAGDHSGGHRESSSRNDSYGDGLDHGDSHGDGGNDNGDHSRHSHRQGRAA